MNDVPVPRDAVRRKRRWWPGWIWSVPIAALGIVAWLAVRELSSHGPSVTVTFETAGGVRADDTKVMYKDMVVGRVSAVTLRSDLKHVDVTLDLSPNLGGHLGPGTRFWIAGQNLSLSNLSALKTLISGPYIGIDPQAGAGVDRFTGLAEPPVLKEEPEGTSFVLHADRLRSVNRGSPIYYRDIQVGELQGYKLVDNDQGIEITAFVQAPYDRLVHGGTRFWDASAVRLSTESLKIFQRRVDIP